MTHLVSLAVVVVVALLSASTVAFRVPSRVALRPLRVRPLRKMSVPALKKKHGVLSSVTKLLEEPAKDPLRRRVAAAEAKLTRRFVTAGGCPGAENNDKSSKPGAKVMLFGFGGAEGGPLSTLGDLALTLLRSLKGWDVALIGIFLFFYIYKKRVLKKPEPDADGVVPDTPKVSALALRHVVQTPEDEAELKTMYCDNCGWTMFVARNRMRKYFRDGIACQQCGAVAPTFYNMNDPDDPINKEGATLDDLDEAEVDPVSLAASTRGKKAVSADQILLGGTAGVAAAGVAGAAAAASSSSSSSESVAKGDTDALDDEATSAGDEYYEEEYDDAAEDDAYPSFEFSDENPPPMDKVPAEANAETTEPALADAQWEAETWDQEWPPEAAEKTPQAETSGDNEEQPAAPADAAAPQWESLETWEKEWLAEEPAPLDGQAAGTADVYDDDDAYYEGEDVLDAAAPSLDAANGAPEPEEVPPDEEPPKPRKWSKDEPVPEHLSIFRELDII